MEGVGSVPAEDEFENELKGKERVESSQRSRTSPPPFLFFLRSVNISMSEKGDPTARPSPADKWPRDGRVMKIFLTWESSLAPSGTST